MKKTFISLFLLSLLTVFGSLSVKADTTLSFVYTQVGYDPGSGTKKYCSGNNADKDKWIADGDFNWNQTTDNVAQREVSSVKWTGVDQAQACTRSDVSFSAANYTLTLLTYRTNHSATMTLPSISINGGDPIYASEARWGVSSTETIVSNQFNYTNDNGKGAFETEVRLIYHTKIDVANSYGISVSFPSGYDRFKDYVKTLTISQDAPTYAVTATAPNGTVSGTGSFAEGATVTLTPNPNPYYAFSSWSGLTGVSVDGYEDDNPLTFTMPAGEVSVTANFVSSPCTDTKLVEAEDYIDSFSAYHFPNGSPQIESDASLSNGKYFNFNGNDDGKDGEINFYVYLPAATYSIEIKHKNGRDKYLNIYAEDPDGNVTYNTVKYKKMDAYNPNLGDDYCGDWKTFTNNNVELTNDGYYLIGLYGKQYAMFDYIKFTANTSVFCQNTITMQKSGDASAADPTSSPANAAMAGTEVTITAGEASANHYFSGWTVSPENAVTFADQTNATTTFVMPEADVTITANYGAVVLSEFTYTISGSGTIDCATANGSDVPSGTVITLTAEPSTDYVFTGWSATAGSFSDASSLTTTFTMPAEAATVTATFAQVDNKIITGSETTVTPEYGDATLTVTSVSDFDAFNHNVLKFAYSDMNGKYKGQKVAVDAGYISASSAGATGFGFYYKTEKADDNVAFCFDTRYGQVKWELQATNNVWKYYYFAYPEAAGWNRSGIIIYMNGDDGGADTHTTYKNGGAFYMSEIAATTITSKPDIANYHYTNDRGGAMEVDDYGTLCLPMAGTISGATLYSVAGKETGDINYLVLEDKGTSVEAGKPYITQSTATSYTVTMSGAHSEVQAGNGLVGTYELINPLTPYNESGPHNYFLYANAFKKAGTGVTVGAYRAYLDWDAVNAAPAQAPSARRIRMVIEGTEVQTGMETVTAMPKTTKVLIDGQLFIIREGKRYTLTGARAQ